MPLPRPTSRSIQGLTSIRTASSRARFVDVSLGADLASYNMPLSLQADLLNATNKKGVYNILSTFGGTHVIPPRMLAVRVRYTF